MINLLPWREQLRIQQQKQFLQLLAGSLVNALIIIGVLHLIIMFRVSQQEQTIIDLQQKNALLMEKATAVDVLRKQEAQITQSIAQIHRWQQQRLHTVNKLDELTRIVPEGIFLSQLGYQDGTLILTGHAESHAPIALLMRHVEAARWLKQPVLKEMDNHHFILQAPPQS